MALLGAAFAPVIHCSIWEDRSIIFLRTERQFLPRSENETYGCAFGYRDTKGVLRIAFRASRQTITMHGATGELPDGNNSCNFLVGKN